MNIGQAAQASGISAKLIRYYESIGLVPKATRTESGYRVYSEFDVHLLQFIKRARTLGFSIERIQLLVSLWRNKRRSSREVKRIALDHVAELKAKIAEMQAMSETRQELADACHGDHRPERPILHDLERPSDAVERTAHTARRRAVGLPYLPRGPSSPNYLVSS
jgi:MerR family copper efflux transcriptional regulator